MTTWVPGEESPDRMDAHVWSATELFPNDEPKRPAVLAQGKAKGWR
jgi:phage terminase large subunit-like protein